MDSIKNLIYGEIRKGAAPVAEALNITNMIAVDEGSLGDFPWYWQSGTNFNANTFNWLNNVFYSDGDYIATKGESFTTAYFNVLIATAYCLSASDNDRLNAANTAIATVSNTLITDWTTMFGPFPSGCNNQTAQLNYIMTQVISWGNAGLTPGQLRSSKDPMSLLLNIPLGAENIVSDLMTYLAKTSSVADIQAAVFSYNNQLTDTRKNISPAPSAVCEGWMQTVDDKGSLIIVPEIDIQEKTADILNNLVPTSGGKSFSVGFSVAKANSNQVNITASAGGSACVDIGCFLTLSGSAGTNLNIFSADSNQQSVQVGLTFNGVTTVTPKAYPYSISSGKGWWNPEPIRSAANPISGQSGYQFDPTQPYNFKENGDFGFISRLMITQQPVITLTYKTSSYAAYQKVFQENSSWGISFLGIPLGGGKQSYYSCTSSYDQSSQVVTLTMSPAGVTNPVTPADQLAYVVGAEVIWMGAQL